MDFNKWWISGIVLLLILLIGWTIKRNYKDRKKFERDSINSVSKVEKSHKGSAI